MSIIKRSVLGTQDGRQAVGHSGRQAGRLAGWQIASLLELDLKQPLCDVVAEKCSMPAAAAENFMIQPALNRSLFFNKPAEKYAAVIKHLFVPSFDHSRHIRLKNKFYAHIQ